MRFSPEIRIRQAGSIAGRHCGELASVTTCDPTCAARFAVTEMSHPLHGLVIQRRHAWLQSQEVNRHAVSLVIVYAQAGPSSVRPARCTRSLPGLQRVLPAARRRRLGGNRGDSPELDAPPTARSRPRQPTSSAVVTASAVGRLTERLIKVIKHAHFPDVLRYNLPDYKDVS